MKSSHPKRINRPTWIAWGAIAFCSVLGVIGLTGAAWRALSKAHEQSANTSAAMYTLIDTEGVLESEINGTIRPAIKRTDLLAAEPDVVAALQAGDAQEQTNLLNAKIKSATEIDAVALFNAAGKITAINTCYSNGQPIAADRVQRVLGADFGGREIIQSCLRNNSTSSHLQFQTHCDITPAFFDSTGLSVAYSVPILDPHTNARIGVISSRLRFERLSALIKDRTISGGSARAYFVTDDGRYFSEAINRGQEQPPIPTAELREIVRPLLGDPSLKQVTKHADKYLATSSLPGMQTIDGGGIHILIVANGDWLTQGPRQARLLQAGGAGIVGALLLTVAGLVYAGLVASRTREVLEDANQSNALLAASVTEANNQLKAAQAKLVDAARKAGMAEVATGVLHNVGNVLNSVNVSAAVIIDTLRKLRIPSLGKIAGLLTEHEKTLADFFSNDNRGKALPGFLTQLATHLSTEQGVAIKEMDELQKNIEHIKQIVGTQQAYASSKGMIEPLDLSDLLESSLRMHTASLNRDDIKIVREFQHTPAVMADKHKVLQILVNLITNARHAMQNTSEKVLTLSIYQTNTASVRICIRDSGCGIAAENLTRIFAHGFTTKADGHGFGLHSSALAAKEMKGSLTLQSDGPGQGAIFMLELPFAAAMNRAA